MHFLPLNTLKHGILSKEVRIAESLKAAIHWLKDIYDRYIERCEHKAGMASKKVWLGIEEARYDIVRGIKENNK